MNACFGGAGPGPGPGGDLGCGDILQCFQGCGQNDQACLQGCFAQGSANGQALYQAAAMCVQANCPNGDQACVQANCAAEVQACAADSGAGPGPGPGPGPGGAPIQAQTCKELIICFNLCDINGQADACYEACYTEAGAGATGPYDAIGMCVQQNCPMQDDACVDSSCGAQLDACLPPGEASCNATINCINGAMEPQAFLECIFEVSAASEPLYTALDDCVFENECQTLDCPACSAQLMACQADQ
ncbi:MAG: hypothetical protein H6704_28735 [Myxococcales bacterium]|nr:hypothetical protein [Myxococcales bacterium]